MLQAQTITRIFKLPNGTALPDPDPRLSPDAVRHYYTTTHPELVNAKLSGPTIDDATNTYTYTISVNLGTKG